MCMSDIDDLSFEDRPRLLVAREMTERHDRRLKTRLRPSASGCPDAFRSKYLRFLIIISLIDDQQLVKKILKSSIGGLKSA